MNRFGSSSMTSEKLSFTLRIERFSMRVCKGSFTSPEFGREKWSLVVHATDGADYDNYIDVRLKRNTSEVWKEQSVKIKLSILDFKGSPALTSEKHSNFFQGCADPQVLTVTKARLFRFLGLNKLRFLPNDTLTLRCELVVHQENEPSTFETRDLFEASSLNSARRCDVAEYFAHSTVESGAFDFFRRFENFSVFSRKGRCASPEYRNESSDCKWSLVLYACDQDSCQDLVDVKLKLNDPDGRGQLVKARLSIVERFGQDYSCGQKQVYFRGSRDEEVQVATIAKKHVSGWLGLNKLRFVPDDALTLHCEIITLNDRVALFDKKIDFERSIRHQDGLAGGIRIPSWKHIYFPILLSLLNSVEIASCVVSYFSIKHQDGFAGGMRISSWKPIYFLIFLSLLVSVETASGVVSYIIGSFFWYFAVPFMGLALAFFVVVLLITKWLICIKTDGEECLKKRARTQNRVKENKSHFSSRQEVVPFQNQKMVPYENQKVVPCQKKKREYYRKQKRVPYQNRKSVPYTRAIFNHLYNDFGNWAYYVDEYPDCYYDNDDYYDDDYHDDNDYED